MNRTGKRRFAIGLGLTLAGLGLPHFLALVGPVPGEPFTVMAVVLGGIASLAIWGIVLSLLMHRREQAIGFALCIPAVLLIFAPFRETTFTEWPILLVTTGVVTAAMLWRWLGPTREHFATQRLEESRG